MKWEEWKEHTELTEIKSTSTNTWELLYFEWWHLSRVRSLSDTHQLTRSPATTTQEARRVALLHRHSQQTPLACNRHSPNGDERRRGNPLVIARRALRSLTHLNHWCVLARETDLLPAWRQSDGVIGQLGLTTFTVHRPSSSVVIPSTWYVLMDNDAHTLARATTPVSLSRRARGTRPSDPREKKKKRILCAFIYGYVSQAWRVINLGDSSLSLVRNSLQRVGRSVPRMRQARAQPVDRSTLHGG